MVLTIYSKEVATAVLDPDFNVIGSNVLTLIDNNLAKWSASSSFVALEP